MGDSKLDLRVRRTAGTILQVAGEILCVNSGLLENSAQGASGELVVQRNNATHGSLFSNFLQNNVTAALTNLTET